jgi:hypothetical protein
LYYALLDNDGSGRLAHLFSFINVPDDTEVPSGAVTLTADQYLDWRANPDTRAYVNGVLAVISAPALRVITGAEFLALWLPAEIAAGIAADPRLLAGAFKAMAQNSVNLDSPELASLLSLAVSKGVLTTQRAAQITAGIAPTP